MISRQRPRQARQPLARQRWRLKLVGKENQLSRDFKGIAEKERRRKLNQNASVLPWEMEVIGQPLYTRVLSRRLRPQWFEDIAFMIVKCGRCKVLLVKPDLANVAKEATELFPSDCTVYDRLHMLTNRMRPIVVSLW